MNQAQSQLLAIEMEHYIHEKSGEIMDEVLRLFPEIDEIGVSLILEYLESTGAMKEDDAI